MFIPPHMFKTNLTGKHGINDKMRRHRNIIMVTAISFLLGLMYEWTGNLFVPMTAHFIIDAVFACQIRFEHVRRDKHDEHVESREKSDRQTRHQ